MQRGTAPQRRLEWGSIPRMLSLPQSLTMLLIILKMMLSADVADFDLVHLKHTYYFQYYLEQEQPLKMMKIEVFQAL